MSRSAGAGDMRSAEMARRRAKAGNRRMDGSKVAVSKECVLLDTEKLTAAVNEATKGGKKTVDGLYLSSGVRLEETGEDESATGKIQNEDAQANIALNRVARTYNAKQAHRKKIVATSKKTPDAFDDADSAKKAKKILSKVGEHEQLAYAELFNFFDVDKDRTWGSIEFAQRMTDTGHTTTVEEASNLLYFAGVRDVDRITYNDFIQLMPKLKAYRALIEKDAMAAFQAHDDGSGYLSLKALEEVLHQLAGPGGMSPKDMKNFMQKANREGTDRIPFNFFIRALLGAPPLLEYKPVRRAGGLLSWFGCGAAQKYETEAKPRR